MTDAEYNEAYREWLLQEEALWEEEIIYEDQDDIETLAWMMAVESKLGPYEDPEEFVCRQDPDSLVDSEQCAGCPLNTSCFGILEMDVADARRKIQDDLEA